MDNLTELLLFCILLICQSFRHPYEDSFYVEISGMLLMGCFYRWT